MSCGHHHGAFSHFRGPNRKKQPIPKCRIDLGLLFEGCIRFEEKMNNQKLKVVAIFHCRQSTLWQLLQEKQIKFPAEEVNIVVNGDGEQLEGKW